VERLTGIARELRITDLEMIIEAGSGHPGGTLSAADMITALYFHKLRLRPEEPGWPDRDRFVLSKGHCIPIVYAAMAKLGFFPEEQLKTLRDLGSPLQGVGPAVTGQFDGALRKQRVRPLPAIEIPIVLAGHTDVAPFHARRAMQSVDRFGAGPIIPPQRKELSRECLLGDVIRREGRR
jgi:hypothetical protein